MDVDTGIALSHIEDAKDELDQESVDMEDVNSANQIVIDAKREVGSERYFDKTEVKQLNQLKLELDRFNNTVEEYLDTRPSLTSEHVDYLQNVLEQIEDTLELIQELTEGEDQDHDQDRA